MHQCVSDPGSPACAGRKREMDDTSKRIGTLLWKLNAGEVTPGVMQKLLQLCAALDAHDLNTTNHLQAELTTSHWDECGTWLTALKRLLKARGG
jgi:protein transport protein SEC31